MQEGNVFEYAVIRVVPRVEREEFINAGVILYCRDRNFLSCLIMINNKKLRAIYSDADCNRIEENLTAFDEICAGVNSQSPISFLDDASRFRWLTATRSTVIQTSKVHPGLCEDPEKTLKKLFASLVL